MQKRSASVTNTQNIKQAAFSKMKTKRKKIYDRSN